MSEQLPGDFAKPFSALKNQDPHAISRPLSAKPARLPCKPQTNAILVLAATQVLADGANHCWCRLTPA
jgi:hypothetical protein